ncbi:MAG TPA: ABC transporter permease subunit [Candidatus Dormibacteraeota bacterium]|jgi:alpha-glucoside transport system permease protein
MSTAPPVVIETAAASAPARAGKSGTTGGGGWRSHLGSLAFLAPGAVWLIAITIYPLIATVRNSFYDSSATNFVGLANYTSIFSTTSILITFRNNVIWVVVFPFLVTFVGLTYAVLAERIRWSTAFKTIIFVPIVFSATASALVWRSIFDLDPHVGVVNAAIQTASDWFNPPGLYPIDTSTGQTVARLASTGVTAGPGQTLLSTNTAAAGDTVQMGLIGISPQILSTLGAQTAVVPQSSQHDVTGIVWRDFSAANPSARGTVLPDEIGLPSLQMSLLNSDGSTAGTAVTDSHGDFRFSNVGSGPYRVQIDAHNFQAGFTGTFWLGTQSLTPTGGLNQTEQALFNVPLVDLAMIIAYLWIWAGFAMVIIGAGLAALDRDVLEAARIDGAGEWATFRRVTMPMLSPVLIVVLVTMLINVLKIFDIIINMAPGSSQEEAQTLAVVMYTSGFTGLGNWGLASAIAVILFILVLPAMISNLRRIRG